MVYFIHIKDNISKQISFIEKNTLQQARLFVRDAMMELTHHHKGLTYYMDGRIMCGQYEAKIIQVIPYDQNVLSDLLPQFFLNCSTEKPYPVIKKAQI